MKRTMSAIVIAALLGLTLAGCGDDDPEPTSVELGKECFDAGGAWNWSEWSGYHCEFGVPQ